MLLTLVHDLPTPGPYAVDESGVVWREHAEQVWARGCVVSETRFVFLRPSWALSYAPLGLPEYRRRLAARRAS